MLKRPRLLVLSGRAGAGSTACARGIIEGLGSRGIGATGVDTGAKAADLEDLIDRTLASAGLGTMAHELPRVLGRFAGLAGALAVHEATDRDEVIIWDAGEIDGFLRLLMLLHAQRGEFAGILSPMAAVRAAQVLGDEDLMAWRGIVDAIDAVRGLLVGEAARLLLVVGPDEDMQERLSASLGQFALIGAACDAIIVNGVPQASDGWPTRWAEPRRQRAEAARGWGVPVIEIPQFVEYRCGAAEFHAAAVQACDVGRAARPLPDVIVERADSGYDLRVHLPGVRPGLVRAGRLGDALVTEVGGIRRQSPLAPVLARCEIEGAGMDGDWLVVRFGRNGALWPEAR